MTTLVRANPSQLARKRKAAVSLWSDIIHECKRAKSIKGVADMHPEVSYNAVRKRWQKFRMSDASTASSRRGAHHLIFSREEETTLAAHLRALRAQGAAQISKEFLQSEARKYFRLLHPSYMNREHHRSFSDGWVQGFKARHGFSTKATYRSEVVKSLDEGEQLEKACEYILAVNSAVEKYGSSLVINMDETPTPFREIPRTSWGDKGKKEKLVIKTQKRAKGSITLIPTVAVSGNKLPLCWINPAKTDRLIKKLDLPTSVKSFYSLKGWTTEGVMLKYLDDVVVPYTKRRPCALLVDSFRAHWTPMVRQASWWYNIELIEVPKGQTPLFQPLDISCNAQFKHLRVEECHDASNRGVMDLEDKGQIVRRAAKAYDKISREVVRSGWKPLLFDH